MSQYIVTRKDGAVGHIVFNKPEKMNAICLEMWQAMGDAMDLFEGDDDVRVVMFSGAGGKAFVAGAMPRQSARIPARSACRPHPWDAA